MSEQDEELWDISKARAKLAPKHDNSKRGRKDRQAKISSAADRRFWPKTGRNKQFNFRARDGLKERAQAAADDDGITLGEWMERAVEAALSVRSAV